MAREISIFFALNAALGAGFKGVFQSASQSARNVTAAIREMEKSPVGHLGAAMAQQREKIKGLAGSLKEARATLATLQSQAQASGTSTKLLATQIRLAEARVNNLSGALSRQRGLLLNTAAQAATSGRSVRQLGQEYDNLTQQIERARKAQAALNANRAQADALRSQRADLNSKLTGAVGAALTVAAPVKLSVDFEQAIANVGAVSNASDEDMKRLTETARQLGRDTMFSASQAAEGMKYLAMAGFNTEKTIAAMPGMLDLAAAANTDLGTTADIASDILTAFGLKASDMGQVADTLAKTFTTSNTDLAMLGETMKYVAPVAASLGISLQETSAYAGAMANAGIKASQGGTVLRAAMLRVAAPPKASRDTLAKLTGLEGDDLENLQEELNAGAEQLAKLGMTTKDSAGNMRPLVDIIEELNLRTAEMGTAEKTEVFKNVFGTEASAGMLALADQAKKTVDDAGNAIVDSAGRQTNALRKQMDTVANYEGTVKTVAKKQMDTTKGSLLMLSSAWQDVGISVGNLFLPCIRAAAGALSGIANVISGVVNRFPTLSKGIALVVGGVLAFTAASVGIGLVLNLVRTSLNGFRGGLLRLSAAHIAATTSTAASTAAAGGFGMASRIAGAGAKFFAGGLRSILMATGVGALLVGLGVGINLLIDNWDAVVAAMSAAWGWVKDTWGGLGVFFSELGNNLAGIWPGIWGNVCQVASDAKASFISIWEDVSGYFANILEPLRNIFAGVWAGVISGANWCIGAVTSVWNGIAGVADWACSAVISLWEGAVSYLAMLWDGISGIFTSVWNGIAGAATWAGDGIVGVWQGVVEFFGYAGQGISDCFSGVWQWVVDAAAWAWEGIAGIWTGVTDFFGGIVESIFGVFGRFFSWLQEKFAWVFSAIDAVGSAISSITGAVKGAWNAAFGDKKKSGSPAQAANGEKATPAAQAASTKPLPEKPATASAARKAQENAPPKGLMVGPGFKPVAAPAAQEAAKKGKSGGGRKKSADGSRASGGDGGGGRSGAGSAGAGGGANSGPVTVVTLDSGNEIKTQFIPASTRNAASNANAAGQQDKGFFASAASALKSSGIGGAIGQGLQAGLGMVKSAFGGAEKTRTPAAEQVARAQAAKPAIISTSPAGMPAAQTALQTSGQSALPRTPAMIAKKQGQKSGNSQSGQQEISIALTQNFDLITQDSAAARKVLEAIKPDFEALVRKALAKIQSDRTRTAYAQ